MATTVQSIIDGAYGWSQANNPGFQATPPELARKVGRLAKALYRRAAQRNPAYFGEYQVADPDPPTSSWLRPAAALTLFHVESAGGGSDKHIQEIGTKVSIVDLKDRFDAALPPRIYRLGPAYFSVGQADTQDPSANADGDALRFFYAKRHPTIVAASESLDATWREEHDELLMVQLALFLALKDKARGDAPALADVAKSLLDAFDEDVLTTDAALISRFDRPSGYTNPSLKDVTGA